MDISSRNLRLGFADSITNNKHIVLAAPNTVGGRASVFEGSEAAKYVFKAHSVSSQFERPDAKVVEGLLIVEDGGSATIPRFVLQQFLHRLEQFAL